MIFVNRISLFFFGHENQQGGSDGSDKQQTTTYLLRTYLSTIYHLPSTPPPTTHSFTHSSLLFVTRTLVITYRNHLEKRPILLNNSHPSLPQSPNTNWSEIIIFLESPYTPSIHSFTPTLVQQYIYAHHVCRDRFARTRLSSYATHILLSLGAGSVYKMKHSNMWQVHLPPRSRRRWELGILITLPLASR